MSTTLTISASSTHLHFQPRAKLHNEPPHIANCRPRLRCLEATKSLSTPWLWKLLTLCFICCHTEHPYQGTNSKVSLHASPHIANCRPHLRTLPARFILGINEVSVHTMPIDIVSQSIFLTENLHIIICPYGSRWN